MCVQNYSYFSKIFLEISLFQAFHSMNHAVFRVFRGEIQETRCSMCQWSSKDRSPYLSAPRLQREEALAPTGGIDGMACGIIGHLKRFF